MERDLEKRFVTKDGKQRISIYQETDAENPRYMTDEPLHCEDWDGKYSIMTKDERDTKSSSCADLIRYFLRNYGDNKKIVKHLKDNYKKEGLDYYEQAAYYDFSRHGWVIVTWNPAHKYSSLESHHVPHWEEECILESGRYDFDIYNFVDDLSDETAAEFANKYLTDKIKAASYGFGYYGDISFDDELCPHSDGIAWLEKEEFLKYSGHKEEYWQGKTLKEIEWLTEELEAWGDGNVYGFVTEKAVRTITNVRYPDGEHDDTEEESTEWEETDSCWGFYGELNKSVDWILESAGFKKEDLEEV